MQYQLKCRRTDDFLKGLFFEFEVPAYYQEEERNFPKGAVLVGERLQGNDLNWLSHYKCLRILEDPPSLVRTNPLCPRCEADGAYTHTVQVIQRVAVESFQGDVEGDFFPQDDISDNYFLSTKLAERIRMSGLSGVEFGKVTLLQSGGMKLREPTGVEVLNSLGKGCEASGKVLAEGVADTCPFCGDSPIFCPECRKFRNPCAKCKKKTGIVAGHEDGPDDRRLKIEPAPGALRIINGQLWDGSDFNQSGMITKRALDFLLSIHAAPFWYRPALVDVTGVSDEKLKQIRAAADPVTPKR